MWNKVIGNVYFGRNVDVSQKSRTKRLNEFLCGCVIANRMVEGWLTIDENVTKYELLWDVERDWINIVQV